MRSSRNTAPIVGGKCDSPLFCTPPAGERPLSIGGLHNGDDEDVKDLASSGGALYEDSAPDFHPERTHGYHSIQKDGYRILRTFDLNTSHPETVTGADFKYSTKQGGVGERYTDMAPSGRSLTSSAVPFRSEPVPDRHYLAHGITSEPHQVRQNSLKSIPTSAATSNSGPIKHLQSLGQLTGYATSEDEDEKDTVRETKKPIRAMNSIYKSAEFVDTDSSGKLEDDQKFQCPEIQVEEPSKSLHTSPPLASNKRSLQKPSTMSLKRGDSLKNAADSGTPKKRPLSPNAPVNASKRPATKGGFVMSSDESDNDTDDDEPTQSKSVAQQASRPLIRPVPMQTALRATPATTPSPAKQVNRTRLNMLLGRNRSATPAPRQSLPPSQSKGVLLQSAGSAPPRGVFALPQVPHDKFLQRNHTQNATQSRNNSKSMAGGKEMESLKQQSVAPKPREATPRITDKTSSQAQDNARSMPVDKSLTREAPMSKSNAQPVRPATATIARNSPQLQQRKPPQGANATPGGGKSSSNTMKNGVNQPRSLLQTALDEMKKSATGGSSDTQPWISEDKTHKTQDASDLLSKTSRAPTKSFPPDPSGSAAPRSSASSKPQASDTPVPKVPKIQPKHQGSNSTQKQQVSNILEESSRSSKSASSSAAQPSQKRKADNISDDAGGTTVTAHKKPAAPPFSTATKPANDDTTKSPLPVTKSGQSARDDGQLKKTYGASLATAARNPPPVVASGSSGSEVKGPHKEARLLMRQTTANPTRIISSLPTTTTPNKVGQKQIVSNSSGSEATKPPNLKSGSKPLGTGIEKEHDAARAGDASKPGPLKIVSAVDKNGSEAQKSVPSASVGSLGDILTKSGHSQRSGDTSKGEWNLGGGSEGTARPAHQDSVGIHATPAPTTSDVAADPSHQLHQSSDARETLPLVKSPPPARPGKEPAPPEVAPTPPVSPPVAGAIPSSSAASTNEDVFILSQPPPIHKEAVPYFEYSVFQKHWSSSQEESDCTTTEITVRPCTSINEANTQAERLFQSSHKYLQDMLVERSTNRDDNGCAVFLSHISPFDYPAKTSHIKIWVQRDAVSKFANQTPQSFKDTTFISSTGYILRLFKLVTPPDSDDSETSSSDSDPNSAENASHEPIRVYYPHARPEVYTTIAAANRAARSLQIELSHEKDPKDAMTKTFQQSDLEKLNLKVMELKEAADGEEMCWQSRFNACGLGGDRLELVVEKARICGPRNI